MRVENPSIRNLKPIREFLHHLPLLIIDIGATGGPDAMWDSLKESCKFLTFDPDPRADIVPDPRVTNHPIGLSDKKGTKTLHLTKFASASSMYEINQPLMEDYLNHATTEVVGTTQIEVTTLDDALEGITEPFFLKIDVEGSDLDILRGGTKNLADNCLGIQIEASLAERHIGGPFFGDIHEHLRSLGFVLFDLKTERWIRRNGTNFITSSPQVIWGDAIYFLSAEAFLSTLQTRDQSKRNYTLAAFIAVLMAYGSHDYAIELLERVVERDLVDADFADSLRTAMLRSVPSRIGMFLRLGYQLSVGALVYLSLLPFPARRKKAKAFLLRRVNASSRVLTNLSDRHNRDHGTPSHQ